MTKDEAVIHLLATALAHLESAETVMHQGVSAEAWPQVGKLLHEISRTMKQVELTLTGFGG